MYVTAKETSSYNLIYLFMVLMFSTRISIYKRTSIFLTCNLLCLHILAECQCYIILMESFMKAYR